MSATTSILNLSFVWDEKTGNLSSRTDYRITNKTESFGYDKLDRLTGITPSGGSLQTFEYGATGNITLHPQLGVFAYGAAQPHALTNVPKTNYVPTNQTITYNAIGKAATISQTLTSGTAGYTISYNPDGERCQTVYTFAGQTNITRYYFDDYEQTDIGGVPADYYCYITTPEGLTALYKGGKMYYLFTDHLGSIVAITDDAGAVKERYSYDAWGRPRNADTWTPLATDNAYEPTRITNRGYTGHEHLFTFGLINMNGRMYDPVLGRFLSPDNYVQSPYDSQNYNRYAYCLNNPLKYTDPTGNLWGLVIGALIGGTANWLLNGWNSNNAIGYFAIGAIGGAFGVGIGMGTNSIMGGGSFGAGFWGTKAAKIAKRCFFNGAIYGGLGGFSYGFIIGFGNELVAHKDISKAWESGIGVGIASGVAAALVMGITGAIRADANSSSWNGKPFRKLGEVDMKLVHKPQAPGSADCVVKTAESFDDRPNGLHRTAEVFRNLIGKKGALNINDFRRMGFDADNCQNISSVYTDMESFGKGAAIISDYGDETGHMMGISKIEEWIRPNGNAFYRVFVMNPLLKETSFYPIDGFDAIYIINNVIIK